MPPPATASSAAACRKVIVAPARAAGSTTSPSSRIRAARAVTCDSTGPVTSTNTASSSDLLPISENPSRTTTAIAISSAPTPAGAV